MGTLTIVLVLVAILVLWAIASYNGLIRRRNRVDEAWADIEVQLKRRHDLIPNLVETVRGYATHERELFEKVTQARTRAMGAATPEDRLQAENALSQTLKSLFAVAENYPQLRASENFVALQRDLTDTEDKIQAARRFFNGNVRDYNTAIQSFPTAIIAGIFGFAKRELFELAEAGEREPVRVSF
ncbi:LemA family protein [Candidatus Azambacteria bacterium]|nr:LemA family protein [Candidatus Azambacteria bacterium]